MVATLRAPTRPWLLLILSICIFGGFHTAPLFDKVVHPAARSCPSKPDERSIILATTCPLLFLRPLATGPVILFSVLPFISSLLPGICHCDCNLSATFSILDFCWRSCTTEVLRSWLSPFFSLCYHGCLWGSGYTSSKCIVETRSSRILTVVQSPHAEAGRLGRWCHAFDPTHVYWISHLSAWQSRTWKRQAPRSINRRDCPDWIDGTSCNIYSTRLTHTI